MFPESSYQDPMQGCLEFLEAQRQSLLVPDDSLFARRHESFLHALAGLPEDYFDALDADARDGWASFFIPCQLRYITLKEREACLRLSETPHAAPQDLLERFFPDNGSRRVRELDRRVSEQGVRRLVMIGSGPLPMTLFWLLDRHPELECLGLEVSEASLALAEAATRRLGVSRLRFSCINGAEHDYREADLVYVANQVAPKRRTLETIAATIEKPVPVLVRDPYGHGWLLAEQVSERLPSSYTLHGTGGESPAFFSHELTLTASLSQPAAF